MPAAQLDGVSRLQQVNAFCGYAMGKAMGGEAMGEDAGEIELRTMVEEAMRMWPQIRVDEQAFSHYLRSRYETACQSESHPKLAGGDLCLAFAAFCGDKEALQEFDRLQRQVLDSIYAVNRLTADQREEFHQHMRELFLVGRGGKPPRLLQYKGVGSLRGWLRVALLRNGVRFLGACDRLAAPGAPTAEDIANIDDDGERDAACAQLLGEFRSAFRASVESLSKRERRLLRQSLLCGRTVAGVAESHDAHRVTVARWMRQVRASLHKATRKRMRQRLNLDVEEFDSVLRFINSRICVTYADLLEMEEMEEREKAD